MSKLSILAESTYTQLKDDVEKLEAEIEVTQEYYSKREIEISAQLGSETSTRSQSEEIHAKQMAKENRLKAGLINFAITSRILKIIVEHL